MAFEDDLEIVGTEEKGEIVAGAIVSAMRFLNNTIYINADIRDELETIMKVPEGWKVRMAIHDALLKMAESVMDTDLHIEEVTEDTYMNNVPVKSTLYGTIIPNAILAVEVDGQTGEPTGDAYRFYTTSALGSFLRSNTPDDDSELETCNKYGVRFFDGLDLSTMPASAFLNSLITTEVICNVELETIAEQAFMGQHYLRNIKLNSGLTTIGRGAFSDCTALTRVEIPSTVETIGDYAFDGCTNLKVVVLDKEADSVEGAPWGAPDTTEIVWKQ